MLNMLKKVLFKQYKKSIFNGFNSSSVFRNYSYQLLDEFINVLADPKLKCSEVEKKIDALLEKDKNLLDGYDAYRYTPLMCAICNSLNYLGTTDRIKLLLDRGANPNVISHAAFGYTPLTLSIKDSYTSNSIIKVLLTYGCIVNEEAIWRSVMFGNIDTVKLLELHNTELISDMRDPYNRTVLDYAELYKRDEYFKYKLYRHYELQKLKSLIKKN